VVAFIHHTVNHSAKFVQPHLNCYVGRDDHVVPLASYASPEVRSSLGRVAELAGAVIKGVAEGTLILMPDTGHIPHLEQPDQFHQAVLKFFADPNAGGKHP
jgi:pimeloyl-ACP methyl ester carboxylesterase